MNKTIIVLISSTVALGIQAMSNTPSEKQQENAAKTILTEWVATELKKQGGPKKPSFQSAQPERDSVFRFDYAEKTESKKQ